MAIGTATATAWESTRRSPRTRVGALLRVAVSLVVLGLACVFLAPTQMGGNASYVVTEGVSMLPTFKAEGLAVTRARDDYRIGDAVAYHDRELHAVVLHRIVARDGNRFVLKGDNNDYRDSYQPTESDVVGEVWVYWPGVGRYVQVLRDPVGFAVLIQC